MYLESLNTYGMESKIHIQSVGNQVMDRRNAVRGMELEDGNRRHGIHGIMSI